MKHDPVVIAGFARTPIGSLQGAFSDMKSTELGAAAVRNAVERSGLKPELVEQIVMGCVLPAGLGQAPARQAAIHGGLPEHVAATTVNKMCGSGMQAAIMAHDALLVGSANLVVAGGMESMTGAPYLLSKHRQGARIGHDVTKDSMFLDGLEDAYTPGKLMGEFAEDTAQAYQLTRKAQDEYALRSLDRAQAAQKNGDFDEEIAVVDVVGRQGRQSIRLDEQPSKGKPERIPTLKPAFAAKGTITAANAASISDGAAALVMSRLSYLEQQAGQPVARVVGHAFHAHSPALFTTAPVFAIRKLLDKIGWSVGDVDLFEINEAFAVVAMIAMRELDIPADKINVNGGACALGHPIGASGARILTTLIAALRRKGLRKGVASLCIGGGEATAMAVELM